MTTTDYLINAAFVFVVLRQARERQLDRRALVVPLAVVFFVAQQYVHSLPTAGNDLMLVALLAVVGMTLGMLSGFATHLRIGENGVALARVGWLAGGLLVAGICARMVFAFALSHGAEPAIRDFSVAHQVGARLAPRSRLDGGLRGDRFTRDRAAARLSPHAGHDRGVTFADGVLSSSND
ncbi:MAG TPA: hypothetical protein VE736_03295 [Gaiellaceae bacterium]|jgi:hypothetical protein|nr:hypothetical protein [Gaiellaceae bacterium]